MSRADNVRKIILEMFSQRGYDVDDEEDNRILAFKPDGGQVCAFPSIINKLNVSEIHGHITLLKEMKIDHGLLVYSGTPTPAVKNVVRNAPDMKMIIELFDESDIQFNITKHRLQPKFERLDKNESKSFINKLKLPTMLRSDPIARFYNYQRGDVIKVTRKNKTVCYRIVK